MFSMTTAALSEVAANIQQQSFSIQQQQQQPQRSLP
jgi:hypothetical protein